MFNFKLSPSVTVSDKFRKDFDKWAEELFSSKEISKQPVTKKPKTKKK